jgi:hypothetical protein
VKHLFGEELNIKILIGPWVGEFGWELFCWQAFIRAIVKDNNIKEVVCVTREGRDILYEDFATVVNYNPKGDANMFMIEESPSVIEDQQSLVDKYVEQGFKVMLPQPLHYRGQPLQTSMGAFYPSFISYGEKKDACSFDILFHCRSRSFRAGDNWDKESWDALLELCATYKVACIGSKEESFSLEGATDLRGVPLRELVDYLASSRLIVGPSSGPMHLATLCKCPQLVWSGNPANKIRYEKEWNPFDVKVVYLGEDRGGWNPDPIEVHKEILDWV